MTRKDIALSSSTLICLLHVSESESKSEYFTGDTSIDGPTTDLTSDVNLAAGSSELSAEDIIDYRFQSLMVPGKKLNL